DLALPAVGPPNTSTSGCQDADYAGMPQGAIIIVQRGTCTFADKFLRADASGAGAMVFINEGQQDRTVPLWFNFRRHRHSDVRSDGRDGDGARERRAQRGHRAHRPVQDRLAPRDLHHE
ncbi:MAG TPA: PA domain-containing protein, partial [Jatrophihabitantaceae bacterium]|nr:PA domain-containing protein [Jatrophihabitantaceae bacterium]